MVLGRRVWGKSFWEVHAGSSSAIVNVFLITSFGSHFVTLGLHLRPSLVKICSLIDSNLSVSLDINGTTVELKVSTGLGGKTSSRGCFCDDAAMQLGHVMLSPATERGRQSQDKFHRLRIGFLKL